MPHNFSGVYFLKIKIRHISLFGMNYYLGINLGMLTFVSGESIRKKYGQENRARKLKTVV